MQQAGLKPVEAWSRIRHPNIIAVQEGFTTRNFGDNCVSDFTLVTSHTCSFNTSSGSCICLPPQFSNTCRSVSESTVFVDRLDTNICDASINRRWTPCFQTKAGSDRRLCSTAILEPCSRAYSVVVHRPDCQCD
jgi:hypothetical protein